MNFPPISSKNGCPCDSWTPFWLKPWLWGRRDLNKRGELLNLEFNWDIMHLVYPRKFCVGIVFNSPWVVQSSPWEILGGKQYAFWSMWEWWIANLLLYPSASEPRMNFKNSKLAYWRTMKLLVLFRVAIKGQGLGTG